MPAAARAEAGSSSSARPPPPAKRLELAQQRYEAGITDILTVLETQRSLLALEDNLFNIRASRAISYIQLYKALGGGWS